MLDDSGAKGLLVLDERRWRGGPMGPKEEGP
jgi:hypothetical protein